MMIIRKKRQPRWKSISVSYPPAGDGDDEEGERDIESWLRMNERNGWRGVTDWRVHLQAPFLRGWFPSQKRKAKRRPK